VHLEAWLKKLLAVALTVLSLIIVWSEVTMNIDSVELSLFAPLIHKNRSSSVIEVRTMWYI
jgi:hypothetical protein